MRRCWFESLRLQPPFPYSTTHRFTKDVRINGVLFTPQTLFTTHPQAIHNDPKEWRSPELYCPERFDPKSPMWLRPDGKPRNPFSFCPFFGGSRICLGKTLAETMAVYTLPLMMSHFDFEFTDPIQKEKKPNFSLLSPAEPVIMMKVTRIRNTERR